MPNFFNRIDRICLSFSMHKAHARGTFPKCKAGLGYCLILRTLCLVLSPLIWERPLPPRSFSPYTCSPTLFLLRSPSVSSTILLHLQPPSSPSTQVELVWQKTQTWKWWPRACAPIRLLHLPPMGDYRFVVWNQILVCFAEVVDVAICGLQQDIVCQFFAARISAILLCLGMLM